MDPGLATEPDGRVHVAANRVGTDFAAMGNDPALVSLTIDASHSIAYGLQGAAPVAAAVSGSTVSYRGVLPSSDLVLDSLAGGVKESPVLSSPAAPTSRVFPLRLKGLTVRLAADGSVELVDSTGSVVGRTPHGYVRDSKLNPKTGRFAESALTYTLITVDGQPALKLSADTAWLHEAARVFPVTVDRHTPPVRPARRG